ncbi:MAG TPA: winged helix-turn-helix domain-containing protein [Streptosporangiaceae bacterium]
MDGDADISVPAALLGEPARARLVLALADGRALPASRLADEAGVAASTASEHLGKLRAAGLLTAETHGRHRYYRLAGPPVMRVVEALADIAPPAPVRSLREGTRAEALRRSRLCYDHLAGRLGVALMTSLIDGGLISGGDGMHHAETAGSDHLSAPGHDVDYRLTALGADRLTDFGVDLNALRAGRRPLIRYCLDWTEQRHHLAGALGAGLAGRMFDLGWIRRAPAGRAVLATDHGQSGLTRVFGLTLEAPPAAR